MPDFGWSYPAGCESIVPHMNALRRKTMPQFAISEAMLAELDALADVARPIDDDDWGSERQAGAQNAFFIRVEAILPRDQFEELEGFCLKANVDEMVDEAMRLIADLRPCQRLFLCGDICYEQAYPATAGCGNP
jgi:hypothetical protein